MKPTPQEISDEIEASEREFRPMQPSKWKTIYRALPCACGHRACKAWHVTPVAVIQGVSFTKKQAKAVAALLNKMEKE